MPRSSRNRALHSLSHGFRGAWFRVKVSRGEARIEGRHDYRLFGLSLRSDIALPELDPCIHRDPEVVRIRLSDLSGLQLEGERLQPVTTIMGSVLVIPDVARFCVRDGREILVDPEPAASERNVRLFLLGSAMGMLLHQRGILPLHANAIAMEGGAVAFLGHSGAGKSTLAAAFHDRGRGILSDDVCAIVRSGAAVVVQPGIPRLRLWRDAVERSGRMVDGYERAFDALDKYTVTTDQTARSAAMPLKAIYLLVREEASTAPKIRSLSGIAAYQALTENTYRGSFIKIVGDSEAHFEACLALSRDIPIFTLTRPWDPGAIGATVSRIEEHLQSLGPVRR